MVIVRFVHGRGPTLVFDGGRRLNFFWQKVKRTWVVPTSCCR